jgi:hypothetical protein
MYSENVYLNTLQPPICTMLLYITVYIYHILYIIQIFYMYICVYIYIQIAQWYWPALNFTPQGEGSEGSFQELGPSHNVLRDGKTEATEAATSGRRVMVSPKLFWWKPYRNEIKVCMT